MTGVYLTVQMIKVFNYLRAVGESTVKDAALATKAQSEEALKEAMSRWAHASKGLLVVKKRLRIERGGRPIPVYALSEKTLSFYSDGAWVAKNNKRASNTKVKKTRKPVVHKHVLDAIFSNNELTSFIKVNHNVINHSDIAEKIGVSVYAIDKVLEKMGLPLGDVDKHPASYEIKASLGSVPARSKINEWLGGTTITFPTSTAGINSITRHFAGA